MHHKKIVGIHPSWPSVQVNFACEDLWEKWLKRKIYSILGIESNLYDYLEQHNDDMMNSGWQDFYIYSQSKQIPLIIYLHPTIQELEKAEWSKEGKQLISWIKSKNIEYIDGLVLGYSKNAYEDNIHLNAIGHNAMSRNLFPKLLNLCKQMEFEE